MTDTNITLADFLVETDMAINDKAVFIRANIKDKAFEAFTLNRKQDKVNVQGLQEPMVIYDLDNKKIHLDWYKAKPGPRFYRLTLTELVLDEMTGILKGYLTDWDVPESNPIVTIQLRRAETEKAKPKNNDLEELKGFKLVKQKDYFAFRRLLQDLAHKDNYGNEVRIMYREGWWYLAQLCYKLKLTKMQDSDFYNKPDGSSLDKRTLDFRDYVDVSNVVSIVRSKIGEYLEERSKRKVKYTLNLEEYRRGTFIKDVETKATYLILYSGTNTLLTIPNLKREDAPSLFYIVFVACHVDYKSSYISAGITYYIETALTSDLASMTTLVKIADREWKPRFEVIKQ